MPKPKSKQKIYITATEIVLRSILYDMYCNVYAAAYFNKKHSAEWIDITKEKIKELYAKK